MNAESFWQRSLPTFIENWPRALCNLSIPQVDIPLTTDEAKVLGRSIVEWGECFEPVEPAMRSRCYRHICNLMGAALGRFPNGAFVRLGSRSPKDAWHTDPHVHTPEQAWARLTDISERMYEDLALCLNMGYAPHIFLRKWIVMEPWQEFRCFQRDGRLVGISQYDYLHGIEHMMLHQHSDALAWAIQMFHRDFKRASHLDDVVFDVFVTHVAQGPVHAWSARLLEINPFFELTDPCLFDWRDGGSDFDGTFRWQHDNKVRKLPL